MWGKVDAGLLRQVGNPQGATDATQIANVRLQNIHHPHSHDPPPGCQVTILLTACDINLQAVRDLLDPIYITIGARFLKMAKPVIFEQVVNGDHLCRHVTAIGVGKQINLVPKQLTDVRHNGFGSTSGFVLIVTKFATNANFKT